MIELVSSDLDELARALEEMPEIARPILEATMEDILILVENRMKVYPPQPDRERGKGFNTYVRGIGHLPRSAFPGAKFRLRAAAGSLRQGGQVRRTSEALGSKWAHSVEVGEDSIQGSVYNTASYAQEVQGELQPAYHQATGWLTLDEVLRQEEEEIYTTFDAGVGEVLEAVARGGR